MELWMSNKELFGNTSSEKIFNRRNDKFARNTDRTLVYNCGEIVYEGVGCGRDAETRALNMWCIEINIISVTFFHQNNCLFALLYILSFHYLKS